MDRPAVPSARRHRSLVRLVVAVVAIAVACFGLVLRSVAILFDPLHSRLHATVDRCFHRVHDDAERMVSSFSARLRDDVDNDLLQRDIVEVVAGGVEPTVVALWLGPEPAR
jgi:DNA-binding LytR/AlgR family response regulator